MKFVGRVVGERCDVEGDGFESCGAGRSGLQACFEAGLLQFQGGEERVDLLFEGLLRFKTRLREFLRESVVGLLGGKRECVFALQFGGVVLDGFHALFQLF